MGQSRTRKEGQEPLSEVEIQALRARLAKEAEEAVTVGALAEASGADQETVQEHLRRIRTEQAFKNETMAVKPSERPYWHWAVLAGVVLIVAGGITVQRIRAEREKEFLFTPTYARNANSSTSPHMRARTEVTRLPQSSDEHVGQVPLGIEALVAIPVWQQTSPKLSGERMPGSYPAQVEQVVRAIEDLAERVTEDARKLPMSSPTPESPLMDAFWNTFDLAPNEVHYAVRGWAGKISGELKFPIGATERGQIRKAVEKLFEDERIAQAKGLEIPSGISVVMPPPGYRIQLAGRRVDRQEGPALAFAPVPVSRVQHRLKAALENAIARDGKPPEGRWKEDAEKDRKIPPAKRYVGSIEGPGGTLSFDFPAGPPSTLRREVQSLAVRAAGQVAALNAQAESEERIWRNGTAGN